MSPERGAADAVASAGAGEAAGLLAALPCGALSFGDDGTVRAANPALRAMLGYAEEEIEGRSVEQLLTVAGRIFYQTHLFPLLRLRGRVDEVFLLLRHKGGGEVGALATAVRSTRGGEAVTDCALLEVRERRKYEDALLQARRTAEAATAALAARTRDLEVANAQLHEQRAELEVSSEQLQEQQAELEMQAETLHEVNVDLEIALRDAVQARHAAEVAQRAAEEANQTKSQFLATMSHELRTPLNAIGGYVQLLEMEVHGPVTGEQRTALERVQRAQHHLLGLINDVLNHARLAAGHVHYDVQDVAVDALVADVEALVAPQFAARGLTFVYEGWGESLCVRADAEKARQVLLNLLTNALKFTEPGGHVDLACEPAGAATRGTGAVSLRVRDTGRGIAAAQLARVFDPFVQVDRALTHISQQGVGLGLAISRDLARGMGGDLTAESTPGAGSTFTLTLPRA